jgi:hypothetical protein
MTLGFQSGSNGFSGGSYSGNGAAGGGTPPSPNPVYGDFRNPNEPGSGGQVFCLPAALAVTTVAWFESGPVRLTKWPDTGQRRKFSTNCCEGGGSGGGIRIDVGTLSGTGGISARVETLPAAAAEGGGRIAIYYQNLTGFGLSNVTAFGGTSSNTPNQMAEQGPLPPRSGSRKRRIDC